MKFKIEKVRGNPQGTYLWNATNKDNTIVMLASTIDHDLVVGTTYEIPILEQKEVDERYGRYWVDVSEGKDIVAYGIEVEEPKEGKVPKRKVTKKPVKKATKKKAKKKAKRLPEDDPAYISDEDVEAMRSLQEQEKIEEPEEIVISEEEINALQETVEEIEVIEKVEKKNKLIRVEDKSQMVEVSERKDQMQIWEEFKGAVIKEYFYQFKIGNKTVTGISYAGVKAVITRKGDIHIIKVDGPRFDAEREVWICMITVRDTVSNLDGIGYAITNPKSIPNPHFADRMTLSKALRNAWRSVIDEALIIKMGEEWLKEN